MRDLQNAERTEMTIPKPNGDNVGGIQGVEREVLLEVEEMLMSLFRLNKVLEQEGTVVWRSPRLTEELENLVSEIEVFLGYYVW